MPIRFSRKWFNPLYFIINEIAKDNTIRRVLVYGGKSSSKTVSISQFFVKECACYNTNTIAFRKESTIIKTTLKKSFNLAIDNMYLYPAFDKLELSFRCNLNSAEIVMKGLDDPEKAKGVESYKYIYLDELNHFTYAEYEQFDLSMRGIEGQKLFASWNPVDENSFVKTEIVDKSEWTNTDKFGTLPDANSFVKISDDGKTILIRTTYKDNYWIAGSPCGTYGYVDSNLISLYEGLREKNFNSYKVNVLGEWGKTTFGGEFLKSWRSEKHVKECAYNPKLAVYCIFDENVNPYFPCGIFQVDKNEKDFYLIHTIAKRNPENTVRHMCQDIDRKLKEWRHTEAVYIGGDATSVKNDVKQEKGHDLFYLIMQELKEYKPRRAVLGSNPSVRMSGDFFNAILEYSEGGLNFKVDKECRVAINDFENTKEDKNGGVDKKTTIDPITKVSSQPYGHFCDLTRYFICYVFRDEYVSYQRGGAQLQRPAIGKSFSKHNY
jgi:hypothetical protein